MHSGDGRQWMLFIVVFVGGDFSGDSGDGSGSTREVILGGNYDSSCGDGDTKQNGIIGVNG